MWSSCVHFDIGSPSFLVRVGSSLAASTVMAATADAALASRGFVVEKITLPFKCAPYLGKINTA